MSSRDFYIFGLHEMSLMMKRMDNNWVSGEAAVRESKLIDNLRARGFNVSGGEKLKSYDVHRSLMIERSDLTEEDKEEFFKISRRADIDLPYTFGGGFESVGGDNYFQLEFPYSVEHYESFPNV